MSKGNWPRCSDLECTNAVREVTGDYAGKRQPEPDGKCSRHRVQDTEFVPPAAPEEPEEAAHLEPLEDVAEPTDSVQISSLREALSEGILNETTAGLLLSNLVAGLEAIKQPFVSCPHCRKRHAVTLPDLASRANAARTIVELIEGKALATAEVEWSSERRLVETRQKQIQKMLDVDLDEEIVNLSSALGVSADSPHDQKFDEFTTEELALFVKRAEETQ